MADLRACVSGLDGVRGAGSSPSTHGCRNASDGVIRSATSHRRHLDKKSMNPRSVHRSSDPRSLLFGTRFLPLLFATSLGSPEDSKYFLPRSDRSNNDLGGTPLISITHAICSASFSPGNSGYPV